VFAEMLSQDMVQLLFDEDACISTVSVREDNRKRIMPQSSASGGLADSGGLQAVEVHDGKKAAAHQ
jgi:hypothetical protein